MHVVKSGDIAGRIQQVLEEEPAVAVAYLFGSVAEGRAGPLSDVDVGVLFRASADGGAEGRLLDRLVEALGTEKVDLVLLAHAPIPLRFRAVREGRVLLSRDAVMRERFEVDSVMRYLDFKPLRDRAQLATRNAILRDE
jgi:predicted nucleotidyltransferase